MFEDQLKKMRFLRNMTQADLAEALKTECDYPVSKATISQLENGRRNPSIELLQNLSKVFKCSVEYLLDIATTNSIQPEDVLRDERSRIIGEITTYINSLSMSELTDFYFKNIPKK